MQNDEASVYYELDLYPPEDYRTGNFIHRTYGPTPAASSLCAEAATT